MIVHLHSHFKSNVLCSIYSIEYINDDPPVSFKINFTIKTTKRLCVCMCAKRDLPHTSDEQSSTIHSFRCL